MDALTKSLQRICGWFKSHEIAYMIFGGVANSYYGNPRLTFDVDVKVLINQDEIPSFIKNIAEVGNIVPSEPAKFIEETGVLPVDVEGVRVDMVIAELPFELEAINRSRFVHYLDTEMRVCTLEDLIVQKVVSTRNKDWMDIETLVHMHRKTLDWDYILHHGSDLAGFLDRSEMIVRLRRWRNEG